MQCSTILLKGLQLKTVLIPFMGSGKWESQCCGTVYKVSQCERVAFVKCEFSERESDKGSSVFPSLQGAKYNRQAFGNGFLSV